MLVWAGGMLLGNERAEQSAGESAARALEAVQSEIVSEKTDETKAEDADMPEIEIDGEHYIGYLEMPTIEIRLPVLSRWSYDRLKIAPCRYWGSAYDDTMVILAHNYRRHFSRIKELQVGDPVQFIDARGKVFSYTVEELEVLQPGDVAQMTSGKWDLTLFTCTYGGTARQAVRLRRVQGF